MDVLRYLSGLLAHARLLLNRVQLSSPFVAHHPVDFDLTGITEFPNAEKFNYANHFLKAMMPFPRHNQIFIVPSKDQQEITFV